jgi:hypothetical protein
MTGAVTDRPQYLLIVRHGHEELFLALRDRLEEAPVQVIWDRRVGERRRGSEGVSPERRRGERRGPGLGLRHLLGFLLAWGEPTVPSEARSG